MSDENKSLTICGATNGTENKSSDEIKPPSYLFSVKCFSDDPDIIVALQKSCCHTCGYPFFRLGELCPECKEKLRAQSAAFGQSLAELFSGRLVHMYGVGYVDPCTPRGRDLIGDG